MVRPTMNLQMNKTMKIRGKLGEKFTKIDTTTVGSNKDTMRKKVFREKKVAEEVVNENFKDSTVTCG